MSSSEENSDSGSDLDHEIYEDIYDNGNNAFALEPEYPEDEVEERLRAYLLETENNDENVQITSTENEEDWCKCENCIYMENIIERVCCQSSSGIISEKLGNKKCFTLTDGFQDVFK